MRDPRLYQIVVLSALLTYGAFGLDFESNSLHAPAIVGSALGTQLLWSLLRPAMRSGSPLDLRSALISSLSLCLLLRTDSPWIAAAVACATISSKYAVRWNGKHVVNPTTFGLVAALLASDRVWISAGQWGSAAWLALLLAGTGMLVVWRAERSDVTWAFMTFTVALVVGRALWLGDPLALPIHALQNGALLIFAFFMISDPRTTPASRSGRLAFALLVATGAFCIQYGFHGTNGPIISLATCAALVPLIDHLFPGRRYEWPRSKGERHETIAWAGPAVAARATGR
jgi:Na+-transporting NADH:ubiquinone oxidoreductase subunit NqrB